MNTSHLTPGLGRWRGDQVTRTGRPPRRGIDRLLSERSRPAFATTIGLALVVVITVVFQPVDHVFATSTKALCLVLPVVFAAVLGGRGASYLTAVGSAVAFGFLVPPYRSVRVAVTQDLVALGVFAVVAILVGSVVARRIEMLAELERQRADLLRSVSHDFRTPLAVIIAASTGLRERADHTPTGRDRMLDLITSEARRLDQLVTNLLDLSRIESGGLVAERQDVDLTALVGGCTTRFEEIFPDIDLIVTMSPDLVMFRGDPVLLDQLVTNLLDNAARHGGSGIVRLEVDGAPSGITVAVTDDGPGLPQDRRDMIFEPFQATGARAGRGIGLAICKAVTNAHHGTISLADAEAGGTTFVVRLPSARR